MPNLNMVILAGHLGKDAETTFTTGGIAKTTFSLATTKKWKDQSGEWKENTTWHNVVAWRKESVANYLTKGKAVFIEGELSTRSYEKDGKKVYVTEVVADKIQLLGSASEKNSNSSPDGAYAKKKREFEDLTGTKTEDLAAKYIADDTDVPW